MGGCFYNRMNMALAPCKIKQIKKEDWFGCLRSKAVYFYRKTSAYVVIYKGKEKRNHTLCDWLQNGAS